MAKKLPEAGVANAETKLVASAEGVAVAANSKLTSSKSAKYYAKKSVKIKAEADRDEGQGEGFEGKLSSDEQSAAKSDGSVKLAMADSSVMSDAGVGAGTASVGGQDASAGGGSAAPAASSGGGGSLPIILGGIAAAGGIGALAAGGGGKSKEVVASPVFNVSADKTSANEGDTIRFAVNGTGVKSGDAVSYQISGISAEDLASGSLTGSVVLDASGRGFVDISLKADARTEGAETVRFELGSGAFVNVAVADTSVNPVYTLTSDKPNANEGDTVRFTLRGSADAKPGDTVTYVISGIAAEDLASGSLTGSFVLGQDRGAFVDISLSADAKTEGLETLVMTVSTGGSTSVAIADTSEDPVLSFTSATDLLIGESAGSSDDNEYVGRVGSTYSATGSATTFESGDQVDGGGGINTLSLSMDPAGIASGTKVSNMQVLKLNLNAAAVDGSASELYLTQWDRSLQQINIDSNKSDLVLHDQQVIAPVSIVDRSTAAFSSSYTFNYAAGVLDGAANALAFTINNVNGVGGSDINIDDGMEAVSFAVADRLGDQYASNIDLNAADVKSIVVTQGRAGQLFTMYANVFSDDDGGASFVSTAFAGDMNLNSSDLDTVALGVGDDTLVISGRGGEGSSYSLGAGDNSMLLNNNLAGSITANGGDDDVSVDGRVEVTGRINVGDGDNTVFVDDSVRGLVLAGTGDDTIEADETASVSEFVLDFNGVEVELDQEITVVVTNGVEVVEATYTVIEADLELTATALAEKLATELGGDLAEQLYSSNSEINGDDASGVALFTLFNAATTLQVSVTAGTATVDALYRGVINAGSGDNEVYVVDGHAGDIVTGAGDDAVSVDGRTSMNSVINVGAGDNTIALGDDHFGSVIAGDGDDFMTVGDDLDNFSITNLGGGDNVLLVSDDGYDATVIAGDGDNRIVIGGSLDADGEIVVEDDGEFQDSSITLGDGTNRVDILGGMLNSDVTFGDGDGNVLNVGEDVVAGEPGTITFGAGDANELNIGGSLVGDAVVFGDGDDNSMNVGSDVVDGTITFGDGADNALVIGVSVGEDTNLVDGATITFGDGGNSLDLVNNTEFFRSTATFGSGDDSMSVAGGVYANGYDDDEAADALISMGGGDDELLLGTKADWSGYIKGSDDKTTTVDMGAGDDYLQISSVYGEDTQITSAGFAVGGSGLDTLRLTVEESSTLIERTENQIVTVDYSEVLFTLGQVITVTFERGDDTFEVDYTVVESDFIQGPEGLAEKVAESIAAQLNDDDAFDALFGATAEDGVVTIESDAPLQDFVLGSSVGDVDVVQISDTEITSFETLELVALNGDGDDDITINADFELIEGTNTVNLISQVERNETLQDEDLNGDYTVFGEDGPTTFVLDEMNGGEAITVSGHETTATGNSQVSRITVDIENDDHVVGDTISVTINDVTVNYVVTAANLNAATGLLDANKIATSLATAITAAATAAGLSVSLDLGVEEDGLIAPQITLIGQAGVSFDLEVDHTRFEATVIVGLTEADQTSFNIADKMIDLRAGDVITITVGDDEATYTVTEEDCERLESDAIVAHFKDKLDLGGDWGLLTSEDEATLTVTRVIDLVDEERDGDQTTSGEVQSATVTDDGQADVVIVASLADDATDTTMDLTVDGEGDFDIAISGGGLSGEDSGTDLELTLGDSYDHTIDTGGIGRGEVSPFFKLIFGLVQEEDVGFVPAALDFTLFDGIVIRVTDTGTPDGPFGIGGPDSTYEISTDNGLTFEPSTFEALIGIDEFEIETLTFYSDEPGSVGVETFEIGTSTEAFGNFRDSITVRDASGVNTTGSDIVLEDVLAHTVTSTSKANLTIDQYSTRDDSGFFFGGEDQVEDEVITVTTGTGDDHLITLAQSALTDGSAIDLGAGRNALSLGWGSGVTLSDGFDEYEIALQTETELFDVASDGTASVAELIAGGSGKVVQSVDVGTRVGGTLNSGSDVDAFSVVLEAGKSYQISFFSGTNNGYSGNDLTFTAYGPDKARITSGLIADNFDVGDDVDYDNIGGSDNGEARTFTPLVSGTYYFEVASLEGSDGDYGIEVSEVVIPPAVSLDFSSIDYTGGLAVFELLNNVDAGDIDLVMPGGVDDVEELQTQDFNLGGDLTIVGADNDFTITTTGEENDFEVNGALIIQNAAGVQITGDLLLQVDDEVEITVGNVRLASITVDAGDDIEVEYARNEGGTFVVGDVLLDSATDDADFQIEDNDGTSVTVGDVTVISDDDSDLEIERNTDLTATVGDVVLTSDDGDADVFITENTDSNITIGSVSLSNEDADDDSWVQFSENTGTTLAMGPLTMAVSGGDYDAELLIGEVDDGEVGGNTGSSVTIDGPITISSDDNIDLNVIGNDLTNVSLADGSVITLEACEEGQGAIDVELNNNVNDHNPLGPDPLSDEFIQDYAVTLGDLVMNAGSYTDLDIIGNDDDTYFGELSVTVGDVDMFSHSYTELNVEENQSVTVTIGEMNLRAKDNVNLVIDDNDGRIYENSLVNPATEEPDYADITIGDIVAVSDGDSDGVGAYLGIGLNNLAQITVGNVSFTALAAAGIEIASNANSVPGSFGEDETSADTEITLGDVSIDGVGLVGVSVGLSYTGRFGSPGELNGGNYNVAVDMGELSLTVTGEDTEAALTVANNRGDGGKGSVDIDSVDVTSSGDVNFFVYNNTLTGASGADAHDMTVGDVLISADEDANLAIVDNGLQQYVVEGDRILTTIDFGDVTLSAGLDDIGTTDNAQVDIEGNDNIDLETGDVTLTGNNTGLFVNENFYTDVLLGDVELTSTEETLADVTVNGNRSADIEMGTVTINSENDALIVVAGNSMHEDAGVTDTTRTGVTIGTVDVVAGEGAKFFVEANSDTAVTIGMDAETVGERGTITIAAAYIGEYGAEPEGFGVFAGEDTDVDLGDVELTASGSGSVSDVDVAIGAENDFGEDSSVDMGDLTVNADGDGYVTIAGEDGNLTVGDIVINVGLDDDAGVDDFGSDLFFHVDDMDGNADNSGANKTQTISLSASSRGTEDGNLHVVVNDAVDLSDLTISGTNAEVYLTGDIGTDTVDTDDFTLDLSGLDGAFGEDGAIGFDPITNVAEDQAEQDDGTYVQTYDADFGTDTVIVRIGSGDMIYNAAHSSWYVGGDDSLPANDWGSPWADDEDGWYSLGDGGDFEPTAMVQTIDLAGAYDWVSGNTLTLDYNNETYTFNVGAGGTLSESDTDAFFDDTGLTIALGEDDGFTITGTPDGAEFEAIAEYSAEIGVFNTEVTSGTSSIDQEDPAEDNWGQEAEETFTFTGDTVGEIVIGGFNPGEWGSVNADNGRLTDRLDFSEFDWNGEASGLGEADLNDFNIEIDDGDGYFKDVVITYIGDGDVEFGEIRLVGAGEFDNAVELVGDSFYFG